jgi:hypothetical protein
MPTNIVTDITDPANLSAWGLHPTANGQWSPGNYVQGTVAVYQKTIWLAVAQTNSTPGTDSTWTVLIAGTLIGVALDGNGFVPITNLPITNGQGKRALKINGGTGGAAWPGAMNWLKIVENALAADEGDVNGIAWADAFWPIGGTIWSFVQTSLAGGLGAFSGPQLASLQSYAMTNR